MFKEHRPFTYRDFLHFEVEAKDGTFRNKVSRLIKAGEVEVSYNSSLAFYTLKGVKFTKRMTGNHMGMLCRIHIQPLSLNSSETFR